MISSVKFAAWATPTWMRLRPPFGSPVFSLGNELHLRSDDPVAFDRFDLLVRTLHQHHKLGQPLNPDLIASLEETLAGGDETRLQQFQETAITIPQGFTKVFLPGAGTRWTTSTR